MINRILKHQAEFITSEFRHTGLVGGYRSGKSQAGVYKTIAKKMEMPGIDVAYYLPTYGLIRDVAFPKFRDILTANGINYKINLTDKDIVTPFGRIILRSMDNPNSIIGYEVGYSLVDECDVIPNRKMKELNKQILARNSAKSKNTNNATDFVSTPEGFNFLYDFFEKNPSENKLLIRASTLENPFISDTYVESLKETYTENQLKAYLNGEFVNLTSGTVYYQYDRLENHSDRTIQDGDVLHIGMDFNITNMSAVVHVTDEESNLHAVDEITEAYDTSEMCDILKERYQGHKVRIYPDASGRNRKSSGGSDFMILKKAGFRLISGKSNPSVRDRITSANKGFENRSYFVNEYNCPDYAEALERLAYKNGKPNKDSGFDHVTDAGTYCYHSMKGKTRPKIIV